MSSGSCGKTEVMAKAAKLSTIVDGVDVNK